VSNAWPQVLDEIRAFRAEIRDLPVASPTTRNELRSGLRERYDLEAPVPLDTLVAELTRLLRAHAVHVVHPRYFGLFNPSVRNAGIIGDTLAALYNPQLAVWSHAPAAQELERLVLERFATALGMDPSSSVSNFATGGAEANLSAVLAALARRFPETAESGLRGLAARPVIYLSEESHHSFVKIARMTGLGTDALRQVRVGRSFTMDVDDLRDRVQADVAAGCHPLVIVGTAGTTGTGAVDPLRQVGQFARDAGIWFHVDAAWGGSAVLSDELRPMLDGIELADSVTWDAHKWLSVPMGAGMFFCRHREAIHRAFGVTTSYMPAATDQEPDPYQATPQWSRRAIGLKVFLSVAELGVPGYARIIEHQARMADLLRSRLRDADWVVVNDTRLPVVCFTHPDLVGSPAALKRALTTLHDRGRVWISSVEPTGSGLLLRACITSFRTAPQDIECLMQELHEGLRSARR
jgi:glutamate/tyrosine decarboxylase-like PLP-dependent enzyme